MSRARIPAAVCRGLLPVNLLISFLIASSAVAEVRETLEYTYYDAVAKPGQSLSSNLAGASPIKEQGRVFLGHTKWDVRWNIGWSERDGTCKITSVKTSVATTMMPGHKRTRCASAASKAKKAPHQRGFFVASDNPAIFLPVPLSLG